MKTVQFNVNTKHTENLAEYVGSLDDFVNENARLLLYSALVTSMVSL